MRCPDILPNEAERLQELADYGFISDPLEPLLDPIVALTARLFDAPAAVANMIGKDQAFFAAAFGVGSCDMGRDVSFCAHTIAGDDVLVVPDATLDERFHDNPLVTGDTQFRFYAGVPLRTPAGHALGALCIVDTRPRNDFSDSDRQQLAYLGRLATEQLVIRRLRIAQRTSHARFSSIARTSLNAIIGFDTNQRITFWNAAAASTFGYSEADAVGRNLSTIFTPLSVAKLTTAVARESELTDINATPHHLDLQGVRRSSQIFPVEVALSHWLEGAQSIYAAIVHDASEKYQQRDDLHRAQYVDDSTGLSNRRYALKLIAEEIARNEPFSVILIRVDKYKDYCLAHGQAAGNKLMRELAPRLKTCLRPIDILARVSDNEFSLLLPNVADPLRTGELARHMLDIIRAPFRINGQSATVTAHCGIYMHALPGPDAAEILSNADLAASHAIHAGNGYALFNPSLRMTAVARQTYLEELQLALRDKQFRLFYQPQISLTDQRLIGVEALLRWQHPERGLLPPGDFLPVLETSPLSADVGDWVIETACRQAAEWRKHGCPDLRIGVNIATAQLQNGKLPSRVSAALAAARLPGEALELEITENVLLEHDHFLEQLVNLRALGTGLAFDDYGTGFASLNILTRYPINRLKIDRSFIKDMHVSPSHRAVVSAIIELGHNLGLSVIAEGVETKEQEQELMSLGCEEGQGYLYAQPLPAAELAASYGLH